MKKIRILPQDLSQEGGELTPTLKVKRAVVASKYEPQIDELYESANCGGFAACTPVPRRSAAD